MFDEQETTLWAEVFHSSDRTGSCSFRYRQPAPGLIYSPGCPSVPQPSAFLEHSSIDRQWGGLPMIPTKQPVVLGGAVHEWAVKAAEDSETMQDLVEFVQAVEDFGPHQATRADYKAAASTCKYLRSDIPTADLGFKWSMLLLLHLYYCGKAITRKFGPYGLRYAHVEVRWSLSNTEAILNCANNLLTRIADMVNHLVLTAPDRQGCGGSELPGNVQDGCGQPAPFKFAEATDPMDEWMEKNVIITASPPNPPTLGLTELAPKKRSCNRLAGGQ
ncbi:hypothetical protein FRC10_003557, partial [Ceratobasidium sp. 414]